MPATPCPEAPYGSLKQQLEDLIINPFTALERDPRRVIVFVFDAFDECEARGAKEILQLLIAAIPRLPFFLKILITSRPENHIRTVLVPAPNLHVAALHDIETSLVKNDTLLYLRHCLRKLGEEHGLPLDWIKESDMELVAERAGNLFIYIATAVRFLSQGTNPQEQLQNLLRMVGSPDLTRGTANPFVNLDKLYLEILLYAIPMDNFREVAAKLRLLLANIVLLRDPLPIKALQELMGARDNSISTTLEHLQPVILTPPPPDDCPRVYHPSFPDFLQDHLRCTVDQIWIHTEGHEKKIACQCLKLLNTKLRKGMLGDVDPVLLNSGVEDLNAKVEHAFPLALQYACRYWVSHLANASHGDAELMAALEIFASHSLLPWIEAMSWLGDTGVAIRCLEAIMLWQAKSAITSMTSTLLNDGYRLLLAHKSTITLSAQHIATSVLPFSPRNTTLVQQYPEYANSDIRTLGGVQPEWSPCLMVWKGHSDSVRFVTYSRDGHYAASTSDDKTIRLWDTISGTCTGTLEGHRTRVTSATFSPDGSTLASGSWDDTVRTWNTMAGYCTAVLEGHSGEVNSVAFSCDGSCLASGSHDCTIRLWDLTTRITITTFEGHSGAVESVAFTPDGSHLASGSDDKTIRIWDMMGRCINILKGHSREVTSVVFAPDGLHLASGSEDNTVRIWDMAAGRCFFTLKGHSEKINSVAFSSNGTHLASSSYDETIRLWDAASGECVNAFRGHSDTVTSIAFSPDCSRLMSGSSDDTVRIWDVALANITSTATPEGHSARVTAVAFSQDGSRVVSGSLDHTARIWDATTGRCLMKLEGPSDRLLCVAFNPDGSCVATGSDSGAVRLWDANTGDCVATLKGHPFRVISLAFSADGLHLKEHIDGTSYFWDVDAGEQVGGLDDTQFDTCAPSPFMVHDGRLIRIKGDGSRILVCFLPPGTLVDCITSLTVNEGKHRRVAIGCYKDLYILEISIPID